MISESFSTEEFEQLIASAASYTTKIEAFSIKITDAPLEDQLRCLNEAHKVLSNQTIPIIKKLFVIRFIKDTMLLASLSFYQCVVVAIFPWLSDFSECLKTTQLEKCSDAARLLRGSISLPTAEMSVCKNFVNLVEEVIKWMGTYIRDHPYMKVKFRSAFRMLLDRLPFVQALRVSNLHFFKPEDPNRYQAYYLENESNEEEVGQKVADFCRRAMDQGEKHPILVKLLETGDSTVVACLLEELDNRLEDVDPLQLMRIFQALSLMNDLMRVAEVEFCNRAKLELLPKVVELIQMLHHHQIQHEGTPAAINVTCMLNFWKHISQQLGLPVECYETALNQLKKEGIQVSVSSPVPEPHLNFLKLTPDINKEKFPQLSLSESQTILKIKMCRYIPLEESRPAEVQESGREASGEGVVKRGEENSVSSNKSSSKKIHYLQTYSRIPSGRKQVNGSEVKEIHVQHSNLSDQFTHPRAEPTNARPLLISFKKYQDSPEVVFSDSFHSNQHFSPKNSPVKYAGLDNKYIDIIEEPSVSMGNSEKSKTIGEPLPEDGKHEGSNKQVSKVSEVSDDCPSGMKYSANFQKASSVSNQKSIIDEYSMPGKGSEGEPGKRAKPLGRVKGEKCSSIKSSRGQPLIKCSSKDAFVVQPKSRISQSRSIKLIQFNEADGNKEQGYFLSSPTKAVRSAEPIKVETTVVKPKFAFKYPEEDSLQTEDPEPSLLPSSQGPFSFSKTESASLGVSVESRGDREVPFNFGDLLTVRKEPVRVNNYEVKIKELEQKVVRMREKKLKMEQEVLSKDKEIMKIKEEMPTPVKELEEENKKLLKLFQRSRQVRTSKEARESSFRGELVHLSTVPMEEALKKRVLYRKCRLLQTEGLDIGFQVKQREMTFYFLFKKTAEQLAVKVEPNSLSFCEPLDTKIYNILEGKQIKFKTKIKDYTLHDHFFELPTLKVDLKYPHQVPTTHNIQVPYHLYNELTFHPPKPTEHYSATTDWHFCCSSLLSQPQYLSDVFPNGTYSSEGYRVRIEAQSQFYDYLVVVEGEKMRVGFVLEKRGLQLAILKCLLSFLQRCHREGE